MSQKKKLIRQRFNDAVFKRDGHKCTFCDRTDNLDAHHIMDRSTMPNGGYVKQNGITLCPEHHEMAELWHQTDGKQHHPGMSPLDLMAVINSTVSEALRCSHLLEK